MEKKIMIASALAATTALVGLAFLGAQVPAQQALATNGLTLLLTSANGLTSSMTNSSETYTWNTDTANGYHTSWSATGVNYVQNSFVHIAVNKGEFHNTVTLHQITSVTATGHTTGGTDTDKNGKLDMYTSSDGVTWSSTAITIISDTEQTLSESAHVGFVKFEYNRANDAIENYVTSVAITYNCVA